MRVWLPGETVAALTCLGEIIAIVLVDLDTLDVSVCLQPWPSAAGRDHEPAHLLNVHRRPQHAVALVRDQRRNRP